MTTNPPSVSNAPVLKLSNVEAVYGLIKTIPGVSLQIRAAKTSKD